MSITTKARHGPATMTLVATFQKRGHTVFLADTLITTTERVYRPVDLPFIDNANNAAKLENGKFMVSRMVQKVTVLRPTVLIAWAGSLSKAEAFINFMDDRVDQTNPSAEDVFGLARQSPYSLDPQLTFLIHVSDGKTSWKMLEQHCKREQHPFLSNLYIAGTGSDTYLDYLDKTVRRDDEIASSGDSALFEALRFVAYIMVRETLSASNLIDRYGGCFEIVEYFEGRYRKYDKILFVLAGLLPDDPHAIGILRYVYFKYIGEHLFAKVLVPKKERRVQNKVFRISPTLARVREETLPYDDSWDFDLIVHAFNDPEHSIVRTNIKQYLPGDLRPITITQTKNSTRVQHETSHYLEMLQRLRSTNVADF